MAVAVVRTCTCMCTWANNRVVSPKTYKFTLLPEQYTPYTLWSEQCIILVCGHNWHSRGNSEAIVSVKYTASVNFMHIGRYKDLRAHGQSNTESVLPYTYSFYSCATDDMALCQRLRHN